MLRNRFVVLSHHKHVYKPFDFVTCTIPTLRFPSRCYKLCIYSCFICIFSLKIMHKPIKHVFHASILLTWKKCIKLGISSWPSETALQDKHVRSYRRYINSEIFCTVIWRKFTAIIGVVEIATMKEKWWRTLPFTSSVQL